jgi:hypothetical protein
MQTAIRSIPFIVLGVLSVACLEVGASCHSSSDCCTGSCSDNACVAKK